VAVVRPPLRVTPEKGPGEGRSEDGGNEKPQRNPPAGGYLCATHSDSASVVIISHNEGGHLRRTVDRLSPTLPAGGEIIVVDDRSIDHSTDFLTDGYDGVTLLSPTARLGVARARNFGAEHARGQVRGFCCAKKKIRKILARAARTTCRYALITTTCRRRKSRMLLPPQCESIG